MNERLARILGPAVGIGLFCAAIFILQREIRHYQVGDVAAHLREIPLSHIVTALGLTAVAYLALTFYDALAMRTKALRTYARLSRAKYDGGATSYIEVLYAENELFAGELNAITTLAQRHAELVNLYKALGGGWVDAADPLAPKPQTGKK